VLVFGRVLGGLSTTLLFSVFETWMITEYHNRGLDNAGVLLSRIFGSMATLSSVIAILAGVLGDVLVQYSASRIAPFLASVICLAVAFLLIWTRWVCILNSHEQIDNADNGKTERELWRKCRYGRLPKGHEMRLRNNVQR
jgi:MFS family permease